MKYYNIVVLKKFRNKGIGSAMIKHLISNAKRKNKNKNCLEFNCNNLIAIYSKFGFIEVGVRKKYYNNKDNTILMDLWI